MDYQHAINRAITFIAEHIEEPICVDDVARHVNISRYHFSRIFKSMVGEGVYQYIKRAKMERAAFLMKIKPDMRLTDIGMLHGYSSANFSTAFKNHFQRTPYDFKRLLHNQQLLQASNYYHPDYPL